MNRFNSMKKLIILSQGGLFLVTVILYYFFRRRYLLTDLWDGRFSLVMIIYTGILAGVGVRLFSIILGEVWPQFADNLQDTVIITLQGIDMYDLFLISLPPAIIEELFFRGFLQSYIGNICTSVVFAILHWGFVKKLWAHGLHALMISLFLGWLFVASGSLLTTITAHFTNNLLAGLYVQDKSIF